MGVIQRYVTQGPVIVISNTFYRNVPHCGPKANGTLSFKDGRVVDLSGRPVSVVAFPSVRMVGQYGGCPTYVIILSLMILTHCPPYI